MVHHRRQREHQLGLVTVGKRVTEVVCVRTCDDSEDFVFIQV